jgi:preprotein translocase subunit SecB
MTDTVPNPEMPLAETLAETQMIPLPDAPGIIILHHALVDLSVENPHGYLKPEYAAEIAPEYQTEVNAVPVPGSAAHRVDVMVRLSARSGIQLVFVIEMTYRAEVQLHQISPEDAQRVLHVDVADALFPPIKEILETCGRYAGYPDMQVHGVDFAAAFAKARTGG